MLTKCPECELQVSDKAFTCPHCGYPLKKGSTKNPTREKSRKRLPNGFGQITKLTGKNLRKPYRAMITVSKTPEGKPICKPLKPEAYFETYNDAYAALVEYNRNPYDLPSDISFEQVYERWYKEYLKSLDNEASARMIDAAWKRCYPLYKMDARTIRARHLKSCIAEANATPAIKIKMKTLFNKLFDYAVEYEITDKNYARDFSTSSEVIKEADQKREHHRSFSEEELEILWKNTRNRTVRMILVQCYMGWRPQELCQLEKKNIDGVFITGGMKTKAGKNRRVPIHHSLKKLITPEGEYLFENMDYARYDKEFHECLDLLGIQYHKPHDGRKTFVTLAKKYNVNEYAIKRMVGHAISDITEAVYTDRDDSWFIEEIEKIKGPVN